MALGGSWIGCQQAEPLRYHNFHSIVSYGTIAEIATENTPENILHILYILKCIKVLSNILGVIAKAKKVAIYFICSHKNDSQSIMNGKGKKPTPPYISEHR